MQKSQKNYVYIIQVFDYHVAMDELITKELLGKRLRELRKRRGLKQETLAELVCFETSNSISNIENGYNYPSIQNLEKILKVLDSSFVEIFSVGHLQPSDDLLAEINTILKSHPQKIGEVYKIIKAITD